MWVKLAGGELELWLLLVPARQAMLGSFATGRPSGHAHPEHLYRVGINKLSSPSESPRNV